MAATAESVVRVHRARIRIRLRDELGATVPPAPGEEVLIDRRIVRGGAWLPHGGFLRVTDRRVLILAGRWLGRNTVIEIPKSLVRVRPAPFGDPVIRLEVAAAVDDDLLAFRANDWFTPPAARGITLRVRQESVRTEQLRTLLVLALGTADTLPG